MGFLKKTKKKTEINSIGMQPNQCSRYGSSTAHGSFHGMGALHGNTFTQNGGAENLSRVANASSLSPSRPQGEPSQHPSNFVASSLVQEGST